jgi:hypothetical protein
MNWTDFLEIINMETHLEDIPVMYLTAKGGSEGAQAAFTRLEAILPSLRGRKIYGVRISH